MGRRVFSPDARKRAIALLESKGVTRVTKVLRGFDERALEAAKRLGMDESINNAGYIQVNEEIVKTLMTRRLEKLGVIVAPLGEALEKHEWARKYYWRAMPADRDMYTALVEVYGEGEGYFIYVPKGVRVPQPIYVCLLITATGETQLLHNIVVLDEGASATLVTGCGASHGVGKIAHVGATEIYIGDNAELNYVMIHSWTPGSEVRPRSSIIVGRNAHYIEYYLSYGGVGVLDSQVEAIVGDNSSLYAATVIITGDESRYYLDTRVTLAGDHSSGELISRILGRGDSRTTSKLIVEARSSKSKGHIECQALQLDKKAFIETIPVLRSHNPGAELSHEAAIGKINEEELVYLMSKGLNEEQARAILLRGFLHINIPGIPGNIRKLIESVERMLAEKHAL